MPGGWWSRAVWHLWSHQGPTSFCLAALSCSVSPHVQIVRRWKGRSGMHPLTFKNTCWSSLNTSSYICLEGRQGLFTVHPSEIGSVSREEGVNSVAAGKVLVPSSSLYLLKRMVAELLVYLEFFLTVFWLHWVNIEPWFSTRSNFTPQVTCSNVWRHFGCLSGGSATGI